MKNKTRLMLSTTVLALTMIGCSSNDNDRLTPIQGVVLGSHYEGAKICQDTNENFRCDVNEEFVLSDDKGAFTLNYVGSYPIIAEIGNNAVKHSGSTQTPVVNPITFYTMPEAVDKSGKLALSAVSTSVVAKMLSYKISFESAKEIAAMQYGVASDKLLENFVDSPYLTSSNKTVLQILSDDFLPILENYVDAETHILDFNQLLIERGEGENPLEKAAIDWTADKGLDFVSDGVFSLLGIGGDDPYSDQLNEMITQLDNINENLEQQTELLKEMESTLDAILNLDISDDYKDSMNALSSGHDTLTIKLIDVGNIIGDKTNEQILENNQTLSLLRTILTQGNLDTMAAYSRMLSGKQGVPGDSNMNNFLQARLMYRDTDLQPNSPELISVLDSTNRTLLGQYIVYLQDMQAIYLMEMLSIYITKNSSSIADPELRNYYSQLVINEPGVQVDMNQSASFLALNTATYKKFQSIHDLFKNEPQDGVLTNWISDDDNLSAASKFTSAKEYKSLVPKGDWQKDGVVYVWNAISDNNFTGSYDGETLTARNGDVTSSLDATQCLKNDLTYTTSSKLVCVNLNSSKLMDTEDSDNYGYTVFYGDTYYIEKVEFNSQRIRINNSSEHAIGSDGTIYSTEHEEQHKQLQYNFLNGEKVLFQFGSNNNHKFGGEERISIGVDCGKAVGTPLSTCSNKSHTDQKGNPGGHSSLILTTPSGQKVMIKIGGRGTEEAENPKAYMDTCENDKIDFNTCGID